MSNFLHKTGVVLTALVAKGGETLQLMKTALNHTFSGFF